MVTILDEKKVLDDKLVVEKGSLKNEKTGETFSRLRVNREDAACVLVLNTDTNKVILTKQFRYPVAAKNQTEILEIVAGKVDGSEAPLETAIRETEEEIGYRIKYNNIHFLLTAFSSPGYTTEQFHLYFATVQNSDHVTEGGGLESENENIELVEMDREDFKKQILRGNLHDMKTCTAAFYAFSKGFM